MAALALTARAPLFCLGAGWLGFGLLWILAGEDPAFSFLFGSLAAFFYLVLLSRHLVKSLASTVDQSKGRALRGLFLRYLFLILVLGALMSLKWIRPGWVLGGLLLIPVSVVASAWRRKQK